MGERKVIISAAEAETLDEAEVIEGYRDGRSGEPEPGDNRSLSYWHGWRNGRCDGNPARFVCIDDDSDFLPGQPHVKTPFESGLGLDHIASAFVALTGQPASWAPRIFGTTGVDDGEAAGPSPLTNTPSEPNTSEDHEPLCECDVCSPHLAGGKR